MRLYRICPICREEFEVFSIDDRRILCPECRKRLKALLYPEKVKEE